jgi:hypothetical protein
MSQKIGRKKEKQQTKSNDKFCGLKALADSILG